MPKPPDFGRNDGARLSFSEAVEESPGCRSAWQRKAENGDSVILGRNFRAGSKGLALPALDARVGPRISNGNSVADAKSEGSAMTPVESSGCERLEGSCLAWLHAWEAREERRLARHEELMRQQLESLRRAVLREQRLLGRVPTERNDKERCACSSWSEPRSVTSHVGPAISQNASLGPAVSMKSSAAREVVPEVRWEGTEEKKARREPAPPGWPRRLVWDLVHSSGFAVASSLMIALYTLAVGVMAEVEMRSAVAGEELPRWLLWVDSFFAASFFVEVLLRVLSDGGSFFLGSQWCWNGFDTAVALVGILDLGLGTHMNLGFFRAVRMLRFFRVIRVIRVLRYLTALRDLRLMTESLCACVPCLAWGLVLLASLQYIMAVVLLRGTQQHVRDGLLSEPSQQIMRESFLGIAGTMLSLTQAISGGRSWGEFTPPFSEVNPLYGACFPAFMVFVIFGALNIMTGIFVESTSNIAKRNRELAVEEELSKAEYAEAQIRDFFHELDVDCSGGLSEEELAKGLQDPRVKAYFSVLNIHAENSKSLFQVMEKNGAGEVECEEFIEKCLQLRGGAMAMDIAAVRREHGHMSKQFKMVMRSLEEMSQKMHHGVHHGAPTSERKP